MKRKKMQRLGKFAVFLQSYRLSGGMTLFDGLLHIANWLKKRIEASEERRLRQALQKISADPDALQYALVTMRRIQAGRLPLIVNDDSGRRWEYWDVDFDH